MPDLPMPKRLRAGRLDPASRRRPDESREPYLDPGFHREPWIPVVATRNRAFAGMTTFLETVNLWGD
jgi:hypothetical protein